MKKLLLITLIIMLALTSFAACGGGSAQPSGEDPTQPVDEPTTDTQPAAEPYTFQPKVASSYLYEVFGQQMVETWFNVVDAVMAGEEYFACPDQETYDWVMGQFPDMCFPVFTELIEKDWNPIENGEGHLLYKKSKEETAQAIQDFEDMIEDILNQTMSRDYSDMENALALYRYFYDNYSYDWDTYQVMYEVDQDYTRCYRFFVEKQGICEEISTAYSYLLMQAGVDATCMAGQCRDSDNHQWSYVKINGRNYHIDPTYALGDYSLDYFMMDDSTRLESFGADLFVITSNYSQDHPCPEYVADDDFFEAIRGYYLRDFDHNSHTMEIYSFDDAGNETSKKFDYQGF